MGGLHEDMIGGVEAKKSKVEKKHHVIQGADDTDIDNDLAFTGNGFNTILCGTQKLRIHESKGKVHFHDDKNKIKAYVPIGQWYAILQNLETGTQTKITHHDSDNKSTLIIRIGVIGGKLDASVSLNEYKELKVGSTLEKLQSFTQKVTNK